MTRAATESTARSVRRLPAEDFELKEIELHGHRVAYRCAGRGPAIVLVHGITSTSATWERVMPYLATRFTVIAPDLLGHGGSAKPSGDYSLGAYASGVRDMMVTLGHERATFVGHSLGGGVVMQLAYQFPERCERLVLVDSGGLGREVNILLRIATLPLSEFVFPLLASARLLGAGRCIGRLFGRLGIQARPTSPSWPAATPPWRIPTRARRSCTRCGRSSIRSVSASTPMTGSISPRRCRS